MNNKEFLQWIFDRLVNEHGEKPCSDYMHRLQYIIENNYSEARRQSRDEFVKLIQKSPIVSNVLAANGSLEDCCIELQKDIDELTKELFRYVLIAPFKAVLPDGSVVKYICPDDLIPIRDLPPLTKCREEDPK